jgi:uncharacterized protein
MTPTIAVVALIASACAGSADPFTDSITKGPVGLDTCAVAHPNSGGPPKLADLALFAYDANAPLDVQKVVE